MSVPLAFRIMEHLKELGLLCESDTILDPMSGISTTGIVASALGHKFIGIELEEKFIELSKKNKEYAERKLFKSFDWQLIKGDSRRLSDLLKGQGLKSVVSPPYAGDYTNKPRDREGDIKRMEAKGMVVNPNSADSKVLQFDYGKTEGQIGKLKDKPLKSITSPPYSETLQGSGVDSIRKRIAEGKYQGKRPDVWLSEGNKAGSTYGDNYSKDPSNIGNLKDTPLKSIVSPPYGETGVGDWKTGRAEFQAWVINEIKTTGYVEWQGKRYNEAEWRAMNHGRIDGRTTKGVHKHPTDGYSDNPDNIGGLPDKPLKAITSPPYSHQESGERGFAVDPRPNRSYKINDAYSDDSDNIGNLKDKPLKSITSPPYGDAEKRDRSKEISNEKEKDYPRGDHNISAGYQGSDDNIGKLSDKPLKSVMSPPYEDGGHHKGMLDSWGGENTPVSNKTKDDHGYGNTEGQIEDAESYLSAMKKVYSEIALVSDCLTIVLKNPTRNGRIRRLDLDTLAILEECGWKVHCQHRALLFEELEQADMFEGSKKQVKGRLSFFKRLSYIRGQPVSSWEDVIICTRK